ncbi:bis(5'-nucleosyl)-tetraphosphatase (symmetrical) ApaH [Vibrio vulnificus]|uniref:Bis(5'-nucleosyl)-tetraphosphatase, symmetrical n=1 Tax=Vibrio vulnificus TaxID=672 RepID=A0A8H9K6K4_VIBVL|nr:bis(5'-nucleosyl)-tetraphosphatase (symmetrical) ApaH [Vibrio vulnificus]EGR0230185.1 bis(5'-nucleosyl)-tetraphosphatase (symmetrical) [Vibrio vulnificus]EHD2239151.1 bis(5'-nucleosyl)-tetraphosphatase (symmetrical) [Vibrio vulnificus]EHU0328280.1 bis(5'-nucleosyl)-tetraphosphatase (symmetrical) ApaH [Vibrio vulnificus]EHU9445172.1 bis(5'-nucleosyl)-tetraphosphatase (symmetrical) ApaH [Vibrio vulnificus]EII3055056.1 bis(5'-nucleosyl)-tetraphosphatase (symmetrical) ApaH [Vibrio vulnificus]
MANYIVGDIQGCFDELMLLLAQCQFDKNQDTLWVAGDLVARGPKSLDTLRFIKSLGDSAKVVLGNHDLHLIAVSLGIRNNKAKDKTAPIFESEDGSELLHWLRQQPLLAEHAEFIVCHAGISPQWDLSTARQCAEEVESLLRSENYRWLIENMYCNQPDLWQDNLSGLDRYRYIINAFTRMRFCFADGRLDMDCKLPPSEVKDSELMPWFKLPQRRSLEKPVLFGHWAALEGYISEEVIGLDTGCVWNGSLTLIRWEDKQVFSQKALAN